MSKHFLIVGGTGNIGSGVADLLLEKGQKVSVCVRNIDNTSVSKGIAPVYFDYDDPASWEPALAGVHRVFMIPKAGDPCPENTLMPFIDAAVKSGVERVVFSTAMGLDVEWRVLAAAEEHLIASGIDYTILRPGWFMQNFTVGFLSSGINSGSIALPGNGECKLSFIDTRDISAVATVALLNDEHVGKTYTLTGPEALSWNETVQLLSDFSNKTVTYTEVEEKPVRDALLGMGTSPYRVEQMMLMMRAMREDVYSEVTSSVEDVLGRPPSSLKQFLFN